MLNNNLSNDQWITKELHGWGQNWKTPKIKWKWKHSLLESVGYSEDSIKREVYSYEYLHWIIIRSQINNLMVYFKVLEK
jgi:hypothetical protein